MGKAGSPSARWLPPAPPHRSGQQTPTTHAPTTPCSGTAPPAPECMCQGTGHGDVSFQQLPSTKPSSPTAPLPPAPPPHLPGSSQQQSPLLVELSKMLYEKKTPGCGIYTVTVQRCYRTKHEQLFLRTFTIMMRATQIKVRMMKPAPPLPTPPPWGCGHRHPLRMLPVLTRDPQHFFWEEKTRFFL